MSPTFKVEGMHYDTELMALTVAERIWERYDGTRTITIYEVNHHGEESVFLNLYAKSEPEEDADQLDLF